MSEEISLTLKVDATQTAKGAKSLDDLAAAGARADAAHERLLESSRAVGTAVGLLATAATAALSGLALMARNAINAADAMNDLHLKTGLAFRDLAAYDLLARQSGTSIQGIAQGFKFLGSYMVSHSDRLKTIGVDSKNVNVAMEQFAGAISSIQDPALKTKLAMTVLGRSGVELLPMLSGGSAAFKLAREQSAAYGIALEKVAPKADEFNDMLARMSIGSKVVGLTMAEQLLPTLIILSDELLKSATNGGLVEQMGASAAAVLKGMAIAAINVVYVFRQIGDSIGGVAAKFAAVLSGDFAGVGVISREMDAKAKALRAEVDRMTDSILNAGAGSAEAAAGTVAHNKALEDAARKMLVAKQAADAHQKSIDQMLASLQKEVDTLGMTTAQIKRYEAEKLNMSGTELARARSLIGTVEAAEKAAKAEEHLAKVRAEIAAIVAQSTTANEEHIARLELENSLVGKSVLQQQLLRSQFESNLALKKQLAEIDKKTFGLNGAPPALETPADQIYRRTAYAQEEHAAALAKIADLDNILARDEVNYKLKQDIAKVTEEAQDAEKARSVGAAILAEEAAEKIKQYGADNAEYAAAALALSRDKEMAEQRGFALLQDQLTARIDMLTAEANAVKEQLGLSENQLAYDNANLELNQRLLEIKQDTVEIEKEYLKQKAAVRALDVGADAKAKLEADARSRQAKEAAILADTMLKTKNSEWVNQFESDFHNSMLRMMEFGSSSWGAMMRGWKNALKTNIFDYLYKELAKPYVFKIIASITGIFGANGMATAASGYADAAKAGTSSTSWLNIGQSLWSALSTGFDKIGTYVAAGVDKLAAVAYNNGLSGAGSALASNSAAIGTAASYIGAGIAGVTIGTFIAGDKTILGLNGMSTSAIGAAIGAKIGLAVGAGPLGAFLGGIAGGVFSAAFGMGPKQYEQSTVRGKFSGDGFKGAMNTHWTQEGGWFRSNKAGDVSSPLAAEGQQLLNGMVGKSGMAFARLISLAGDAARSINGWNFAIDRALLTEEDMTKLFGDMADSMGKFVLPELEKFRAKGENLADTAVRMGDEFIITDTIFKMMGFTAAQTGIASLGMRDSLIQLMGGIQSASSTMESYYKNFYSEDEQHANAVRQLGDAFKVLGLAAPQTRAEFRSLAETLVTDTTPAGQTLFAAVMKLNPAFASATQAAEDLAKAAKDNLASALKQAIADLQPMSRAMAQAQIKTALLIAKAGGPLPTAESLSGALDAIRRPSEELFAAVADYKRDQQLTANNLSDLAMINDTRTSTAEQTLTVLTDTQAIIRNLQAEVAALRSSSEATAASTRKTTDLLTNVTRGGESLLTTPA